MSDDFLKITLVTRADVHVADDAPEMRCDDWRETSLGKLRQINGIAADRGASAVLDAGDLFYVKSPGKNTHYLVSRLIEVHAESPCPVLLTVGNHDIRYDNLGTLEEQPLNVLERAGSVRLLGRSWVDFSTGSVSDSVPSSTCVRIVGVPYRKKMSVYDLEVDPPEPNEKAVVAVVHYFASPTGGDFFGTIPLSYADLRETFPFVSAWVFGHWHRDQGIRWIDGVPFVNVGSVSRGSLREENLQRIPKVGVLELQPLWHNGEDVHGVHVLAEEVELDVKPAEEVFRVEDKERIDARMEKVNEYAGKFKERAQNVTKSDDVVRTLREIAVDASADVVSLAEDYLREAGL